MCGRQSSASAWRWARRGDRLFRRVVAGAVVLASVGAALGTVTSIAAGSLLRNLLFDTRTTDPFTYAAVIGGVIALTIAASIGPALRGDACGSHHRAPELGIWELGFVSAFQIQILNSNCVSAGTFLYAPGDPAGNQRAIAAVEIGREDRAGADPPREREIRRARQHLRESHRDIDDQPLASSDKSTSTDSSQSPARRRC